MSVRVALVGLGDIGLGAHLPALLRHDEVEVAAVVDPDPARRERAAGIVAAASGRTPVGYDAADDVTRVDAAVVATPPWVTPDVAVTLARRDLAVLIEKPVATSPRAALGYDDLASPQRRRIQVGLTYRHDPAIETLRNLAQDGRFGGSVLVRAHIYDERLDRSDDEHRDRLVNTLGHGTPVVHEGAHVFDWLAYVLGGSPAGIDDAWALTTQPDLPAPNITGARLHYPGGHVALVEFGWLTEALPRCELTVLGARASATLDVRTFDLDLDTTGPDGQVTRHEYRFPGDRTRRCFDRQLATFVDLVSGRRDAAAPGLDDGLTALETAHAIVARTNENGAGR